MVEPVTIFPTFVPVGVIDNSAAAAARILDEFEEGRLEGRTEEEEEFAK